MNGVVGARLGAIAAARAQLEEASFVHGAGRAPPQRERPEIAAHLARDLLRCLGHEAPKQVASGKLTLSHYILPVRMFMSSTMSDSAATDKSTIMEVTGIRLLVACFGSA